MKIEPRQVYEVSRPQYVGYNIRCFKLNEKGKVTGYDGTLALKSGEQLTFTTLAHGKPAKEAASYEPTETQAWDSFDAGFKAWLADQQGFILWLDTPHLIRELKGYVVWCRLAVTEDKRFIDVTEFPEGPPIPAKYPAMSIEEMLIRK